jgi:uncharacterized protein YkwD
MNHSVKSGAIARMPLSLEVLEARCLLSMAVPTAAEQQFLQLLNSARANPAGYGASIGVDLSGVAPSQPLAFDPRLIDAARGHSIDMIVQNYFSHDTPQGVSPGQRLTAAGYNWQSWGESIAAGPSYPDPASALAGLIIDQRTPDLGHRRQLLAIDAAFQGQNAVGIGVVLNSTGQYINYYTVDTASAVTSLPYLTGVVMNDANQNGAYDIGEGLGNVTITVAGVGGVATWDSGGYSFQVAPGTYTVTASGGNLAAPITQVITVGSQNVALNFTGTAKPIGNDPFVPKIYQTVLGRQPSASDLLFWNTVIQSGASHAVLAAAIESSSEARGREISGWYQTYLGRSPSQNDVSWWTAQLNGGLDETGVEGAMLGSPEYLHLAQTSAVGSTNVSQAFIQSVYRQVLERNANIPDTSYWLNNLLVNSPTEVAQSILNSSEARSDAVEGYYQAILGRSTSASAGEVAFWATSALTLEEIRIQFESSAEFA